MSDVKRVISKVIFVKQNIKSKVLSKLNFCSYSKCPICIFQVWHFPPIFVLLKLTCLVTLFDRKLQVFKNSPKGTIFGIFLLTFVHSKCKRNLLRSQCWMRLFLWFSNTVELWNNWPKYSHVDIFFHKCDWPKMMSLKSSQWSEKSFGHLLRLDFYFSTYRIFENGRSRAFSQVKKVRQIDCCEATNDDLWLTICNYWTSFWVSFPDPDLVEYSWKFVYILTMEC